MQRLGGITMATGFVIDAIEKNGVHGYRNIVRDVELATHVDFPFCDYATLPQLMI
jgi:hypothetical protein